MEILQAIEIVKKHQYNLDGYVMHPEYLDEALQIPLSIATNNQFSKEKLLKFCRNKNNSHTSHISCTGAKYYRFSPKKLAQNIYNFINNKESQ